MGSAGRYPIVMAERRRHWVNLIQLSPQLTKADLVSAFNVSVAADVLESVLSVSPDVCH
jgi:hypothetical protein